MTIFGTERYFLGLIIQSVVKEFGQTGIFGEIAVDGLTDGGLRIVPDGVAAVSNDFGDTGIAINGKDKHAVVLSQSGQKELVGSGGKLHGCLVGNCHKLPRATASTPCPGL